jgi:hypothetical protein
MEDQDTARIIGWVMPLLNGMKTVCVAAGAQTHLRLAAGRF